MHKLVVLIASIFVINVCYAQQKIVLLSGKVIEIKDFVVKYDRISFSKISGNSEKKRSLDKYRVFSIINTDGTEQIIYEPDTSLDLSVNQMRIYIEGEQAAMKYYKKPANAMAGFMAGVVGSYFTFYGLPVPILYGALSGRISPKVRLPEDAIYLNQKEPEFIEGYKRKGRDIKTKQTLISGLIGFAMSVTFFSLYEGNVKF